MCRHCLTILLNFLAIVLLGQDPSEATSILQAGIKTMGGDSLLKKIQSLHYTAYAYRNAIEQSERPDGPFIFAPYQVEMDINLDRKKLVRYAAGQFFTFPDTVNAYADTLSYAEKNGPGFSVQIPDRMIQDEFDLSPSSLFNTALRAAHLKRDPDTILQKNPQQVISFNWRRYPVRIFINQCTHFLTACEVTKPYNDDYSNIWGDSKKMVYYSLWYLEEGGLHYPRQKDVYLNGWHYYSEIIEGLEFNKPKTSIDIPDSIRRTTEQLESAMYSQYEKAIAARAKEIRKGIWVIGGPCNTTLVEEENGIILIEAAVSSEYANLILKKTHALFPSKKILAMVTTSDAWLHIGGLREFAANQIPIYHLDLNRWIINKLLTATYFSKPDNWEKTINKRPVLISIANRQSIGSGPNRLELIPYRTETGERMMMVYFPVQKLIYASDLYQPKGINGSYWEPHYPFEFISAVESQQILVDSVYAMHLAHPIPYREIRQDVERLIPASKVPH